MEQIALANGVATESDISDWFAHGEGLGMSRLINATSRIRHKMFLKGQLVLNTRNAQNSP